MSRLTSYLLVEGRTQEISEDQFQSYIDSGSYVEPKTPIYRHISAFRHMYGYIDPTKYTRTSLCADNNYYTLLIDNLPSWKGWPKRSKAIVGTTDMANAKTRAQRRTFYKVFPVKDAIIGVCPSYDIWLSFEKALYDVGFSEIHNLNEFMINIRRIIELADGNDVQTYKDLLKYDWPPEKFAELSVRFEPFMSWKDGEPLVTGFLNRILDPDVNDFTRVRPTQSIPEYREVWIADKCLFRGEG